MKLKIKYLCAIAFWLVSCQRLPVEQEPTAEVAPSTTPFVIPANTAEETKENPLKIVLLDYALSWDGKVLATYTNTGIYFYELPSMKKSIFLEFEDSNYSELHSGAIAFSPDGKLLAISGKVKDSPIAIWEIKTKKVLTHIYSLPNGHFVTEIEYSPNGQKLAVRNTYPVSMHCEAPEDKLVLLDLSNDTSLFEIDKCVIYPPIQFRFTYDDKIFLYFGSMSSAYSVYVVDSNTGEVILKEDLEWINEHFYDISPDGRKYLVEDFSKEKRVTNITDSQSNKILKTIEGKIISFYGENGLIVSSYAANPQWGFWEDDKLSCIYDGVQNSPKIKMSANGEIFIAMKPYGEYQIWEVPTCSMIGQLKFEE
jgi:WD40 repeat protein